CPRAAPLRLAPANHAEAPRLAGDEQLVRVDLVEPADEVAGRVVRGRAVEGRPLRRGRRFALAALECIEPRLRLLGRLPLLVTPRHALPFPRGARTHA